MPAEHEGFAPASWLCTCPALTIPKPSGLQALRKPDGRRTAGQAMRMHCSMHDCTQKQCRLLPCVCSCTCLHSSAPAPLQDVRHGHGSRHHFCALHVVTGLPYKIKTTNAGADGLAGTQLRNRQLCTQYKYLDSRNCCASTPLTAATPARTLRVLHRRADRRK